MSQPVNVKSSILKNPISMKNEKPGTIAAALPVNDHFIAYTDR